MCVHNSKTLERGLPMSRSYRHHLVVTDRSDNHRYQPTNKQIASRITRHKLKSELQRHLKHHPQGLTLSNLNHKRYRHLYESYNIVDYKARYTKDTTYPIHKWRSK